MGAIFWCGKHYWWVHGLNDVKKMSAEKVPPLHDGGETAKLRGVATALGPPPSDDLWSIGWILSIREFVERTTSCPTTMFCCRIYIAKSVVPPLIKWCHSPKIDDIAASPGPENCSVVSQLAQYSKGWIQLVNCIVRGSSHFCIILRYKKRLTAIMRGVVLLTTHPMLEDANTTLDSIANELTFPVRGHIGSTSSSTYGGKCQEFFIFGSFSQNQTSKLTPINSTHETNRAQSDNNRHW